MSPSCSGLSNLRTLSSLAFIKLSMGPSQGAALLVIRIWEEREIWHVQPPFPLLSLALFGIGYFPLSTVPIQSCSTTSGPSLSRSLVNMVLPLSLPPRGKEDQLLWLQNVNWRSSVRIQHQQECPFWSAVKKGSLFRANSTTVVQHNSMVVRRPWGEVVLGPGPSLAR